MKAKELFKEYKEVWKSNKFLFILMIPALIIVTPVALLDRSTDRIKGER